MRSVGIRPATRSLHRPRYVAKRRPRWLAFLLRSCAAAGRLLPSIGKLGVDRREQADLEERELAAIWPMPERDHEGTALDAARVRRAEPMVFATSDAPLQTAAKAEGLRTFNPEMDPLSKLLKLLSR